jgi:uncharacterized membrane protein YvbJ
VKNEPVSENKKRKNMEDEEISEKFHRVIKKWELKSKEILLIAMSAAIVLLLITLRIARKTFKSEVSGTL